MTLSGLLTSYSWVVVLTLFNVEPPVTLALIVASVGAVLLTTLSIAHVLMFVVHGLATSGAPVLGRGAETSQAPIAQRPRARRRGCGCRQAG
jgi:hypothetical protein